MLPVEIVAWAASRAGAVSPIRKRTPQRITANELVILCTRRISPPFHLRWILCWLIFQRRTDPPFPLESATNHAVRASELLDSLLLPQMALMGILIDQNASHRQAKINIELSMV